MLSDVPITHLFAGGALLLFSYRLLRTGRRDPDFPPGPPTLPILGNLPSFPIKFLHLKFTEWANQYGEIFSLKLAGGNVVVLSSLDAVMDIMEKRSMITAFRPRGVAIDKATRGLHFFVINPGPEWRAYNRATKETLSPASCLKHKSLQDAEVTQLLWDIVTAPDDFYTYGFRYSSSVVFSLVCGKRAPRFDTPFMKKWLALKQEWAEMLDSGAILDFIPVLQYLPPWSGSFKRLDNYLVDYSEKLLNEIETREANGSGNGCHLETIVNRADEWGLSRETIGSFANVVTDGAADTTVVYIQSLILHMMAFPKVQARAHEEIDSVIGRDRAPTPEDLDRLPYIQAVIKEVHRSRPIAPIGFPHSNEEDMMYGPYRIPKGTTIFVNWWGISRDPGVFDDPEAFDPDRYMKHPLGLGASKRKECDEIERTGKDKAFKLLSLSGLMYGAGRRKCPGMHLANSSVELTTMKLLWAFDFLKPKDERGHDIEPDLHTNYKPGIVLLPAPFKCDIKVRSPRHESIIRRDYHDASTAFEPFERDLAAEDRRWAEQSRAKQPTTLVE